MASPAFAGLAVASMVLASLAFTGTAFANTAGAAVLHVPGDFPTIQGCINAAIPGDECLVAPGTYNELIDFHGKAITLRSSDGPEVTIIDAAPVSEPSEGKPVVRCDTEEGPDTVLDGFTLTGGTGTVFGPFTHGGGMYNNGASPTVTNCNFSGNSADVGAGMHNRDGGSPTVTNCNFTKNSAANGGGMANSVQSNPTLNDCTFTGNSAVGIFGNGIGGGIFNSASNPTVTNCTFNGNTAGDDGGGGMANIFSDPIVTHCAFSGNSGYNGGGMANRDSNPTVADCTFSANSAGDSGGGMWNCDTSNPTVTNCTFSDNTADSGGGMYNRVDSSPTVLKCLFVGNATTRTGGGMRNFDGCDPSVTNCMFLGNTAIAGGGMFTSENSHPTVTNCVFAGNIVTFFGGGMANFGHDQVVNNCTFIENSAVECGGGVLSGSGSRTLGNCIAWGNAPDQIADDGTAMTTLTHSNVQGGWPGVGNIDADPMFVRDPSDGGDGWGDDPSTPGVDEGANDDFGDLRLMFGSPCIDAGDNAALPADALDLDDDGDTLEAIPFDLDGHARVLCTVVDMGAYESGIGDDDCDGIVGLGDFGAQFDCLTGPAGGLLPGCEPFDFDGDGDVDVADLGGFQRAFTGLP